MALTNFITKVVSKSDELMRIIRENPLSEHLGENALLNASDYIKEKIPEFFNELKNIYDSLIDKFGNNIPDNIIESTTDSIVVPDYVIEKFNLFVHGGSELLSLPYGEENGSSLDLDDTTSEIISEPSFWDKLWDTIGDGIDAIGDAL